MNLWGWLGVLAVCILGLIANEVMVARMSPQTRQKWIDRGWMREEPRPLRERLRRALPFLVVLGVIAVALVAVNVLAAVRN
jgi:hypothetical protein